MALSGTEVKLTWTDNSTNEDNFKLRSSEDNVDFSRKIIVAANQTTYTDTGLDPGKTYYYMLKAENHTQGDSAYVGPLSVTTPSGVETAAP